MTDNNIELSGKAVLDKVNKESELIEIHFFLIRYCLPNLVTQVGSQQLIGDLWMFINSLSLFALVVKYYFLKKRCILMH